MPVSRYVDIHFPINGLLKLQNGWYYSHAQKVGNIILVSSFLIANEYTGQNQYLVNQLHKDFNIKRNAHLILEKDNGFAIKNSKNKYLFSLLIDETASFTFWEEILLLLLIFLVLISVYIHFINRNFSYKIFPFLLLISYFSIVYVSNYFLEQTTWLYIDKRLFAHSYLFPSLYVLFAWSIFFGFTLYYLKKVFLPSNSNSFNKTIILLLYSLLLISFLNFIIDSIIKDSSYFVLIEKLLSWNTITSCFFILSTSLIYFCISTSSLVYKSLDNFQNKGKILILFCFIGIEILLQFFKIISIEIVIYFTLLIGFQFFNLERKKRFWIQSTLMITISAFMLTFLVSKNNETKENNEKQIYVEQLTSDRDISLEIEFQKSDSIWNLQYLLLEKNEFSKKELNSLINKCFSGDFWKRYEIEFYIQNDLTIFNDALKNKKISFEQIISKHSSPSQLNNSLYFIKDFTSQLSYISKKKINENENLYLTFKSKKIPEKIGFPRLLISDKSQVLKVLEKYSLAKYYNNILVSENGAFNYPQKLDWLPKNKKNQFSFSYEKFKHFVHKKTGNDVLIISKENDSFYVQLSTFSFLFTCYFILFIIHLFYHSFIENNGLFTLSLKIQGSLFLFTFLILGIFTMVSIYFIKNQFEDNEDKLLLNKTYSVKKQLNEKEFNFSDNSSLNRMILDWKNRLQTDINIYNSSGYLLSTTEPRIYNYGVISDLIHFSIKKQLQNTYKKSIITTETIGKLKFKSAYFEIKENVNTSYFIHLTQFRQQEDFEKKIEEFILSLINLLNVLLVLSLITAVIISNWLSKPLKVIQESLTKMQIGKYNEPIPYQSDDELGQLIVSYNQKLNELALSANQLAQNEREMAWREMAKQIAHEIKNPLTPMKLSLQHFQRIFDPNDPEMKEKLNLLIVSLSSQIDSLVKISNEFSQFATLPKENFEEFDIIQVIENCVSIYNKEINVSIEMRIENKPIFIKGDKNLMLHVFNNLFINAIQAQQNKEYKKIEIICAKKESNVIFKIKDEGIGIPDEMKKNIFKANFTTKTSGSGLGLAFVYQIIQAHKGQINFESEKDKFTEFIVHLPLIQSIENE
ncbi:MAG: HAMP domain-containing histidine kinase [Flavobacteriia bacterium]|nr:HAMP domain-containing histidine kinase [Flavobacteriia bacterium]